MKNKETGEFELLVGNGQIVSGFFILALLLAVFFALGFIVARAKYQQEPATTTASSTPPEARRQPAAIPTPAVEQPPAEATKEPSPYDGTKAPVESAAPPQPVYTPPDAAAAAAETMQGTYWQVTATKDPAAARAMLQSMKDMGLPASLSPGPNAFTRVLVGPYTDNATMAKVKTQLENAGLHPVKHIQ